MLNRRTSKASSQDEVLSFSRTRTIQRTTVVDFPDMFGSKISLFVVLTLISLCGVRMPVGQNAARSYDDPEAYAVFSAILEDEWPIRVAKAKRLVIQVETTDYHDFGIER